MFSLVMVLKSLGLIADRANNGLVAFEMVKTSFKCCPYRLVLMDVNMRVMDGIESTQKICEFIQEFEQTYPGKVCLEIAGLTADTS